MGALVRSRERVCCQLPVSHLRLAKIVEQVGRREDVEGREAALAARIVVVAVDRKARQLHVVVWVLVVDILAVERGALLRDDLHADVAVAEAVGAEDLDRRLQRLARRLVLVEEVAREQHHVDVVLVGELEDLLCGPRR